MQDVGESWLMVSLTTSPMLVALVETASSLPIVLLALPAGALARQHARGTASDREMEQYILGFHIGAGQHTVTHLIAERVSG
jgi:hypothetical protein